VNKLGAVSFRILQRHADLGIQVRMMKLWGVLLSLAHAGCDDYFDNLCDMEKSLPRARIHDVVELRNFEASFHAHVSPCSHRLWVRSFHFAFMTFCLTFFLLLM
jgi:hypothetical protein